MKWEGRLISFTSGILRDRFVSDPPLKSCFAKCLVTVYAVAGGPFHEGGPFHDDRFVWLGSQLREMVPAALALSSGAVLDGEALSLTLPGNEQAGRQAPLFFRRPPARPGVSHGYDEDNPDLAVRDCHWQLLVNYNGSLSQSYDLEVDPSESTNRVTDRPQIAERLRQAVMDWNSGLPIDAGDSAYVPHPKGDIDSVGQ